MITKEMPPYKYYDKNKSPLRLTRVPLDLSYSRIRKVSIISNNLRTFLPIDKRNVDPARRVAVDLGLCLIEIRTRKLEDDSVLDESLYEVENYVENQKIIESDRFM